jgi:hypothetical protein
MTIWERIIQALSARIASDISEQMQVKPIVQARAYRLGFYNPQLKVKLNQFDDNIGLNLAGLLVNRVVSQMLGGGFTLDFEGDTETANEQYVNGVLEANKQEVLFHRAGVSASEAGTGYLLLIPDGVVGEDGVIYPRLQLIDPAFVTIETLPEDYELVVRYTIAYKFTGADGKEHQRKRVIEHSAPEVAEDGTQSGGNTWVINDFEQAPGGQWELVGSTPWPYDFAPLLHWQNLPSATDVYGEPDLTAAQIALQDRINFVSSNISKLIRYYAHPMRIGKGVSLDNMKVYDSGPDKMLLIPGGPDNDVKQLEALGDLESSMAYLTMLRQAFFACGRVVDLDSMTDKLGSLTNFGLRVMYQDNIALVSTKRELFGDMLEELARCLQILNGMQSIPCTIVWPDFLPENEVEEMTAIEAKMRIGIMSKQTAAAELGLDWEKESERIEEETASQDNIGAALLRGFTQGGGGFGNTNNPNRSNNNA